MKQTLLRNIIIVTAIFATVFSIMLITNYFQVISSDTLQSGVLEKFKVLADQDSENVELQAQIRELDLLARKAYFVSHHRLMWGVYILIAMALVLVVSARMYYNGYLMIPQKDIDPIDDWAIKTLSRKYVVWGVGALVCGALAFGLVTSEMMGSGKSQPQQLSETDPQSQEQTGEEPIGDEATSEADTANIMAEAQPDTQPAADSSSLKSPEEEISKVTFNSFRGNYSTGVSSAKDVAVKWNLSKGENILWKSPVPKGGYNSPVINGNKVFISGADNSDRELYCYEITTGKLLWTLKADGIAGSPSQMPQVTHDTGLAASTVTTNGKQVCAIFASGDMICADMEGKRLWAKNIGVPNNHYGYASSLLSFGNLVMVQYDNSNSSKVMAFDMATGAQRWSKDRPDKIAWSSPIIANTGSRSELILMGNPSITSYNPSNGEQYWRVECLSGEVGASPCAAAGVVYGASEYSSLIAINAADGSQLWKVNDFLPEVSSPVATRNHVFVATSYGMFVCYDAKTGAVVKENEYAGAQFYSSPVIAGGMVYLFDISGKVYIFSANANCTLINTFSTGERTFATPAFTDTKIVVRTENSIYCVGR